MWNERHGPAILAAFLVAFLSGRAAGQYAVRSPYLVDPALAIGYVDSCARLWEKAYDSQYGGFFTNIGRSGNVKPPNDKYMMSQSRNAYGFVRAFMLTGEERYLTQARRALDFMYARHWDAANGGWLEMTDRMGNPASAGWQKTAYQQHYALLGPSAYIEATQDTMDWNRLRRGYESIDRRLWDAAPATEGYFDRANADWSARTGKSFNATVDAVTTHLLSLYQMTLDTTYAMRLQRVAGQMVERFAGALPQQRIGFVESFGSDWSWNDITADFNTRTIMGHVLKTAWCLGRIHQLFPDEEYVTAAESLMADVLRNGYDHQYGGPYKDYDRVTGTMFMYGQDTAKAWWQMEQAVTAGLMLFEVTGKEEYLEVADETVEFFMRHFVDRVYGDVYADRFRNGAAITAWGDDKGNPNKAGYHSIELGYYIYLYGSLFVRREPVTLSYRFEPLGSDRLIPMNPVDYASAKYRIRSVRSDGQDYTDYDAGNRTLRLPAGTGGLFTVVYEPVLTDVSPVPATVPSSIKLCQNFPNPFNSATTIRYTLPLGGDVRLAVYDMLGREVAVLEQGRKETGRHEVRLDASALASGTYLYRLKAGGIVQTRRMILLR
jgi:mannose/cellobiose epimerase-like protein (N-acyl-D-glucosamine 2-epimerase family)